MVDQPQAVVQIVEPAVDSLPKWFVRRVLLPVLPVFVPFVVGFFIPSYNYSFPNQSVIVIAFVFPLITMTETKNDFAQLGLTIASLLCLTMYIFSLLGEDNAINIELAKLYWWGLVVFIGVVATHIIFKLMALGLFSRKKS